MNKVWENILDDRYEVFVERTEPYKGILIMKEDGEELLREDTSIGFDAKFGPDFADVLCWENRCVKFIDSRRK